jgi:AcrR family transcriptional regulator
VCYAPVMVTTEPGLRERKKQQTRQLILETAARLFTERGFESVTVAEIARGADLSEVTVFNYFPSKEDLVFGRMEFFEEKLIAAVRGREAGESVLAAFLRPVLAGCKSLGVEENAERISRAGALINSSLALQVREREVAARYTQLLAQVLAEGTGMTPDDVELQGVAGALMSVHRALVIYVRARALAGRRGLKLAAEARAQAARAFARFDGGLATYAIRRA